MIGSFCDPNNPRFTNAALLNIDRRPSAPASNGSLIST